MNCREWGVGSGTLQGPIRRRCAHARGGGDSAQGGYGSPRPPPRRSWIVGIAVVTACSGVEAGSGATMRDSAGITIVENPAASAEHAVWTVVTAPAIEIGVLEGEEVYQLSRVGSARRLSDGRIVIANGGTHDLRFYGPDGAHRLSVGREGEGPGEFKQLGLLVVLPGDTLAAYDWNLRRLSFFDAAGGFVRSLPLEFPGGAPSPIGRFPDGSWLANRGFVFRPGGDGSEVVRDTLPLLLFGPDGALRDSIGRFPGTEFYVKAEGGSAFASSLPYGRSTETAMAGAGFYAGHNERYDITRYSAAGAPQLIIRLARDPAPLTDADIEAHKAERLAQAEPGWRAQLERLYRDIPFHSSLPAFADLVTDADGFLWVLDYTRAGDDTRRWTVFGTDGRALGSVETPPGLRVLDIGHDYVLGVWQDALDVEHVRLHELRREP